MRFLYLLATLAVAVTAQQQNAGILDLSALLDPDHVIDANAKSCVMTAELLQQAQQPAVGSTQKFVLVSESIPEEFSTRSAQLLSGHGFEVCRVPAELALQDDVVLVDERGRSVVYYGRRQPETLFSFIQKHDAMLSSVNVFQTITNKMEKKALDTIMEPKLVAFIPDVASPAWQLFQQVAAQASAQMPVFVTHDAHMAAKFRLTAANQIVIIRRLEKSYTLFDLDAVAGQPALTSVDVLAWIGENRGLVIHELDDLNLYDPELRDPTKYIFVAIGDKATPFGIYFHKALMKTIRNITKENQILEKLTQQVEAAGATGEAGVVDAVATQILGSPILLDDIEIVWIDGAKFPNAVKKFSTHFQVPATLTGSKVGRSLQFGLMQRPVESVLPVGTSQWFDVAQLFPTPNVLQQKFDEQASIAVLKNWILSMTDRLPVPVAAAADAPPAMELPAQEFVLEPEAVTVRQGASFILNCKSLNKQGKCQWQKDGLIVPVSSTGHFRLVNAEDPEDCSLAVSSADPKRDTGSWTCHISEVVVGQSTIAAVQSTPAEVTVQPAPAAPKTTSTKQAKQKKQKVPKQKKAKQPKQSKTEL